MDYIHIIMEIVKHNELYILSYSEHSKLRAISPFFFDELLIIIVVATLLVKHQMQPIFLQNCLQRISAHPHQFLHSHLVYPLKITQ